jgi:signal transduction histidine kinase
MSLVGSFYVAVPILALVINPVLAVYVYRNHLDARGSRWFVASLVTGIFWMGLFAAALLATDRSLQIQLFILADKAMVASIGSWLVFASLYSRTEFHRHPLGAAGFLLLAVSIVVPTSIEPFFSAWYSDATTYTDPIHYVYLEPKLLPLAVAVLMGLLSVVAVGALLVYLAGTPRESGTKVALLVTATTPIPLFLGLGLAGVFPAEQLNHSPYGVLPFNLLMTVVLFRFRLFDVQPIARTAVVKHLEDPVFVFDDQRRLTDYNDAAARLLPVDEDEMGEHVEAVLPEISDAVAFPDAGDTASEQLPLVVDGDRRHFSVNVSRIGGTRGGPADWYSVVLRDVTELERSRAQLATQNERLDQVASTISHDLRNPINVADGYAGILLDRLDADDVDEKVAVELRGHVAQIEESNDRMLEIIDDILTIAREGKTVEETEAVTLAAIAEEAWGNVDTGEATMTVVDDCTLQADRSKLLTIFENLFRNSIDHCQSDVAVEVGATDDGFYVADDGPGIPEQHRDQIFEYGYTTGTEGTGLGLSIVRTMAESHGWTVDLDEATDGARFVVSTGVGGSVRATE